MQIIPVTMHETNEIVLGMRIDSPNKKTDIL